MSNKIKQIKYNYNIGEALHSEKYLLYSSLNRFDAVSAYMRKMERYGLSDF